MEWDGIVKRKLEVSALRDFFFIWATFYTGWRYCLNVLIFFLSQCHVCLLFFSILNSSSNSPFCKRYARTKNGLWLNFTAGRITVLQYLSLSWQLKDSFLSCSLFLFFPSSTVFTPFPLLNLTTFLTSLFSCPFSLPPVLTLFIKICHPCRSFIFVFLF